MSLKDTLRDAANAGKRLAQEVATAQFGDDSPESRTIERRFTAAETAALLGYESPDAIYKAEKDGRLPPADMLAGRLNRRMGYTIEQIDAMRDTLNRRPGRGEADPQVISICGHKGGSYKTSTSVHMAQWLSMNGYKVLLVDIDPQATASLYFGYVADQHTHESQTALPYMLGEASDLEYAIHPTSWPGLDIIPSCLGMHRIESEMVARADAGQLEYDLHMMLRSGLETIYGQYDLIIVDGSPNLGIGTINMACAADVIICPTPAEMNDYMSTAQFFSMLADLLDNVDLGGFEPDLRVLITKVNHHSGSQCQVMTSWIRATFGRTVMNNMVFETAEVGKGQVKMRTIFEQSKEQKGTLSAWKKAVAIWQPVFDEIMDDLIKPRWGQEK